MHACIAAKINSKISHLVVYFNQGYIMRILKIKSFCRWAKELGLGDKVLIKTVDEMNKELYEANLGGNVYKKRIAIGNRGKRGGIRVIVVFKSGKRTIFIYGFAKNKRANITPIEEEALKALAKTYINYDEYQINQAIKTGELIEVQYE